MLSRRASTRSRALLLLVAIAAAVGACSSASPIATPAGGSETLKGAAGTRLIGTAVGLPQLDTDSAYSNAVSLQFNAVTPENAMKWESVEPARGTYDWTGADDTVNFADAHGEKVRGHTLVWYNQLPGWLSNGGFSGAELSDILQNHITTEMGRYKGKIYAWDVVNEPFADDGTMRDTIWSSGIGPEYIADALKWARATDPAAKLYINDYDIEGINAKSDAMYDLVKSLKAQGVPIDGVGFQGHLDLQYGFPTDWAENMRRFTDLGLEVAITELDVRLTLPATDANLAKQADYYKQAADACVSVPACVGITVWGFDDRYSWVPGVFTGEGAADIFDDNLAPKPAFASLLASLKAAPAK